MDPSTIHNDVVHACRTAIPMTDRQFPPVNPNHLMRSAETTLTLLKDAEKVVNTFSSSRAFSERLMTAAQRSQKSVVNEMIRKIGLTTTPDIVYNPDGIRLDFHSKTDDCHVITSLKWRKY